MGFNCGSCNGNGCDMCIPIYGGCDPCQGGFYPYNGSFGCGNSCQPTYITRPFAEAQELIVFPVSPYTPSTASPANSFLCGPCKPVTGGNWCTLASTSLCCDTSIQDIVYYLHNQQTPAPTDGNALANKIVIWLNPCALPGPSCHIKACLTIRGVPTETNGVPKNVGLATYRFHPTVPVSIAPGCPTKIEFEFHGGLIFNFANSGSNDSAEAHLALRFC